MANHFRDVGSRKLRVFLCHASEDKPVIREIYQKLRNYNINPWLDERNLLPGENWELLIPEVIRECDIVLLCLSQTFLKKESYVYAELRIILETAKKKPFDTIFHIPFRLDECEIPSILAGIHYVSNFIPEDFEKLLLACEKRREWLNDTQALGIEPLGQRISPQTGTFPSREMTRPAYPDPQIPAEHSRFPLQKVFTPVTRNEELRVEHFDITTSQNPINVFLSYAHEDEWLLGQLEAHLSGLKREGLISTWCDRQIMPGSQWVGVIDQHLEEAALILLLVSSDFLNSDYCYGSEIKRAMERHQAGTSRVIPLIMRPTDWKKTPLADLRALPTRDQPVTSWPDPDQAFLDIVSGIRLVVDELISQSRSRQFGRSAQLLAQPSPESSRQDTPARPFYTDLRQTRRDADPPLASGVYRQGAMPDALVDVSGQATHLQMPGGSAWQSPQSTLGNEPFTRPRPMARFGAPFPEIWNVPRRHSIYFTGRASVLEQIYDTFSYENTAGTISPQAITGLGGMGKTQLAVEYAFRFREAYDAVLWVRAESQETLLTDFRALANQLHLPQELLKEQTSLLRTMREWFRSQSKWLLIFDNADNPGLVDPFIPRAGRGHILVTTRASAVVEWAPQPLHLEELSREASSLCILLRAGLLKEQQQLTAVSQAEREAAYKLADLMKGLPLALEQAGAYINDTACGIRRYLTMYEKYRVQIQSETYSPELREYPESIPSVWKISRIMVEQSNPAAAELLGLCAFLAPEGIPDELIFRGASELGPVLGPVAGDELRLNQAISVLKKYSLLHREVDHEADMTTLSMHRIMQELLIDEMNKPARRLWAERAVRATEKTATALSAPGLPDPWPLLQEHARKCQQLIAHWHMTFPAARRLLAWIKKYE